MAIVTLTSDFGHRDAYVAILKATLLTLEPNINIIDISHEVEPANIAHGAFVIGSAYANFPKKTVHLIAVDSLGTPDNKFIAVEIDEHIFIGADNGLMSLISEFEPDRVVLISEGEKTSFPAKDILAAQAIKLSNGTALDDIGTEYLEMKKFLKRSVKANKEEIVGHVAHIDHFGNLITNILKRDFDILSKDKKYTIGIGKEYIYELNYSPSEVDAGDCFVLFNHMGLLEIGIKNGRADQLLGLEFDSPVWIKFNN
ncbi:MAG: S-adenosyl-l-methionine hydroxide adenosyltransferase [Bacteroidetes bacterium]|nr:MAG: S-adenosyl-l-methionine hydroxide adenosyltransferase [Bacteroidota bacterium]